MQDMTIPVCGQCGIAHPPIAPGEICPMATVKLNDKVSLNWNNSLFEPLKKVLDPLIKVKNYDEKQTEEIFKKLIVDIVKIIETY